MNRPFPFLLVLFLSACAQTPDQQRSGSPSGGVEQIQADIRYLASDELEGRDTGTEGERLAADYIVERMKDVGLAPAGTDGWFQSFDFDASPILSQENRVTLNGRSYDLAKELYPLSFSGSGAVDGELVDLGFGIEAPDLGHNDYADITDLSGKVALISVSSPDGIHPHSAYVEHNDLRQRAQLAMDKGVQAVLFYKDDRTVQDPSSVMTEHVDALEYPVLFLRSPPDKKSGQTKLDFTIIRERMSGKNVIGFDDKGRPTTIVIGAHYDHLGHGITGSLHAGDAAVHNGADDNASGVAAILQIALDLKGRELDDNILYIAFSGEERGLLGSNHFSKNPTMPIEQFDYMINLDMVGRLDSTENVVGVNAVGTSPSWGFIDSLEVEGLRTKTTRSGTGPSDHTSFYLQDMPVLHFFSGTHEDYHKPSDDESLINYDGIERIIAMIEHIIEEVDDEGELEFSKTAGNEERKAAAFKVTFGVIPDYLYDGKGMRIDGVTEGRPADKAGLQKGDVVMRISAYETKDIYAYMEALSKFEPGISVEVTVLRDGEQVKKILTFD